MPSTPDRSSLPCAGTIALEKPRRAASARRRWVPVQARTSPVSEIYPTATRSGRGGVPLSEDTMEMAIARSIAGSTVRAPPTVET